MKRNGKSSCPWYPGVALTFLQNRHETITRPRHEKTRQMFMKHYAPNRRVGGGGGGGGGGGQGGCDRRSEVFVKIQFKNFFF